jgi:hypothetical protein
VGDPQKSRSASFLLLVSVTRLAAREERGGGGRETTREGVVCGLRCAGGGRAGQRPRLKQGSVFLSTRRFAHAFRGGLVGFSSSVSPLHRSCGRARAGFAPAGGWGWLVFGNF